MPAVPFGYQLRSPEPQLAPAVKLSPELGFGVNPPYPAATAGQQTPTSPGRMNHRGVLLGSWSWRCGSNASGNTASSSVG